MVICTLILPAGDPMHKSWKVAIDARVRVKYGRELHWSALLISIFFLSQLTNIGTDLPSRQEYR